LTIQTMSFKIFSYPNNPRVYKVLIAARYNGVDIEAPEFNFGVDNQAPEFKKKNPLGKVPVLETPEGPLWESNAIVRYIARLNDDAKLYGSNKYEAGLVDQWIDFSVSQIELPAAAWLYPIFKIVENNPQATNNAKGELRNVLALLNEHLETRTYLVNERITLADIVVSSALLQLFTTVLDPGFRKLFVNVVRWFTTLVNQPHFKAVLGEVVLCVKMAVAPKPEPKAEAEAVPEKKEAKPKEKREKKPKAEDEEDFDDVPNDVPKAPNPLDLLPPTPLNLEEWKRIYSNQDTRTLALPWFWDILSKDPTGWAIWKSDYKFNSDLDKLYMTNNLVGGFIQRCEKLRKYGFGSILIFGEEGASEIAGVWLFRGLDIPAEMLDVPDYESYNWKKLDWQNEEDKTVIEDFFAWNGDFGGKKFNDQGKVFK